MKASKLDAIFIPFYFEFVISTTTQRAINYHAKISQFKNKLFVFVRDNAGRCVSIYLWILGIRRINHSRVTT